MPENLPRSGKNEKAPAETKVAGGPTVARPQRGSSFVSPGQVDFEPPVLRCLSLVAGLLGRPISTMALKAGMPQGRERPNLTVCVRAAEQAGLTARTFHRAQLREVSPLTLPCILLLKNDQACVLTDLNDQVAEVIFPEVGNSSSRVPLSKLQAQYSGYVLLVHPEGKLDRRASELKLVDTREWFWGTILKFIPIYKHVLLATIVINFLALASPLFIMNVYDRVVPNSAFDTLWALAIGVVIAYVFDFLLRNLRGYFADVAGKNADVIIASKLMQQMTAMRFDHKPDSAGTLANNLREFESLRDFFSSTTLMALVDLPFVFIFVALIGYIAGPLALAPLIAVPLVVLVGVFLQQPFQKVIERSFREGAQKNALLVEAINGLETIKTSMAEGQIQKRWEEVVGLNARSTGRARALANFSITFSQWSAQLVSVMIIIGGVYLIADGQLTLGGLIACNILVGRAMAPLGAVAATLTRLQQSRMALKALDLLMKQPNERPEGQEFVRAQNLEVSIGFEDVHFQYPNTQVKALDGVSLQIEAGEKIGVIGRIGSGKSTLLKLLSGLVEPSEGTVLLDNTEIAMIHRSDVRRAIGYQAQSASLLRGTIRDNLAIARPSATDEEMIAACDVAGVMELIKSNPRGLDLMVNEAGEGLSGGQKQSLFLARTILRDPAVLLMDEPTASMDDQTEMTFTKSLGDWAQDRTVIIATHRLRPLSICDRLIMINDGRIAMDGPKDEVMEKLKQNR
jgi:ATP-binding cassette subfamily C protein LapB